MCTYFELGKERLEELFDFRLDVLNHVPELIILTGGLDTLELEEGENQHGYQM